MPAGAGVLVLMEVMQPKPHFFLRQTRIMDERNGGRGRQDGEFLAGMADRRAFAREVYFHIHRNRDAPHLLRVDVEKFYLEKVPILF